MSDQILTTLLIQGGALIGILLNSWREKIKTKKENKIIIDSLKENYAQTSIVKENQEKGKKIVDFNLSLKSKLQSRRSQIIRGSKLDTKHKSILKKWAKLIEELAFEYYYNEFRGITYEMKDFLEVELADIEHHIKSRIEHDIKETKIIKYDSNNNPTTISFYTWITDEIHRKPFARMELLSIALEHNGFDDPTKEDSPDFIYTMDENLKLILESYVNEVNKWNDLEEPIKKNSAIDYKKILDNDQLV